MRTTLTLDPDVVALLEQETHRLRRPFKQVVNEALRRGLTGGGPRRRLPPFRLEPHHARLLPGIDRASFNRLADELEDEVIVARLGRGSQPRPRPRRTRR